MNDDLSLTIRRRFPARRERVFALWTEKPRSPSEWWGPKDFTLVAQDGDLRPGGRWQLTMRGPDGAIHVNGGVYREVVRPERLVMTHAWLDEAGRSLGPETLITVTLTEVANGTEMLFEQTGFASAASRDGHGVGWGEAFDAMARALAG